MEQPPFAAQSATNAHLTEPDAVATIPLEAGVANVAVSGTGSSTGVVVDHADFVGATLRIDAVSGTSRNELAGMEGNRLIDP